jgi:hypothetical protein
MHIICAGCTIKIRTYGKTDPMQPPAAHQTALRFFSLKGLDAFSFCFAACNPGCELTKVTLSLFCVRGGGCTQHPEIFGRQRLGMSHRITARAK